MPDWRVSAFRRTAVQYLGIRYAVAAHREEKAGQHVYTLEPWPDELGDRPGREIDYDDAYVDARERIHRAVRTSAGLALVALPFVPVIGLLPSALKTKLHGVIAVHPNTAVRASIFLEYMIGIVAGVLGAIHMMTGRTDLTAELANAFWLAPVFLIDAMLRSNCAQDEAARQYGFYEWLIFGWGHSQSSHARGRSR